MGRATPAGTVLIRWPKAKWRHSLRIAARTWTRQPRVNRPRRGGRLARQPDRTQGGGEARIASIRLSRRTGLRPRPRRLCLPAFLYAVPSGRRSTRPGSSPGRYGASAGPLLHTWKSTTGLLRKKNGAFAVWPAALAKLRRGAGLLDIWEVTQSRWRMPALGGVLVCRPLRPNTADSAPPTRRALLAPSRGACPTALCLPGREPPVHRRAVAGGHGSAPLSQPQAFAAPAQGAGKPGPDVHCMTVEACGMPTIRVEAHRDPVPAARLHGSRYGRSISSEARSGRGTLSADRPRQTPPVQSTPTRSPI